MSTSDFVRILGVDIDNVISLTDPAIRKLIWDIYGIRLKQEQIIHFDYHQCGITVQQERGVFEVFDNITCGELSVVPGAIEAMTLLKQQYPIVLVTSRNPMTRKRTKDWIRVNNVPHNSLIFEKAKHEADLSFGFFVEDNGESALSLAEAGVKVFLFDYPRNHNVWAHPNITRVLGWQDVLAELVVSCQAYIEPCSESWTPVTPAIAPSMNPPPRTSSPR